MCRARGAKGLGVFVPRPANGTRGSGEGLDHPWTTPPCLKVKEKLWYNSAARWFHDKPSEPKRPHTVYTSGVELNSIGLALKRATAQKSTAVDASKVRNHYQLIMFD